MFRIKTDIRQFKCETEEKVEDLIRKWIIRPSDLILDVSGQDWSPIGEHPDFGPVFHKLVKHAQEQEDSEATVQDDERSERLEPTDASEPETFSEAAEPSTLSEPAQASPKAAPPKNNILRKKFVIPSEPLPIPAAPAGVEPPPVSDEVTIMTERTADLLGFDDSAEGAKAETTAILPIPAAPAGVEPPAPQDEPTQIFAKREDEEDEETADGEEEATSSAAAPPSTSGIKLEPEPEQRLTRKDLPEELFLTNELSSPFIRSELMDELGAVSSKSTPSLSEGVDSGWDSLMDDFRSTDEFELASADELRSTQEFSAQSNKIIVDQGYSSEAHEERDEVTLITSRAHTLSEASDVADDGEDDDAQGSEAQAALADGDLAPAQEEEEEGLHSSSSPRFEPLKLADDADEAGEIEDLPMSKALVDELRRTQEGDILSSAPSVSSLIDTSKLKASPPSKEAELPEVTPEDVELAQPVTAAEPQEDQAERDDEEASLPEISADPYTELSEESDPFDTEALLGPDEPEEIYETPKRGRKVVVQDREFISKGYDLELPFPVGPSEDDARYGVIRARRSEADKDAMFPAPHPKKSGELYMRQYGSSKDWSPFLLVALLSLFVLLVITFVAFSN